jgi:hypothetical protein
LGQKVLAYGGRDGFPLVETEIVHQYDPRLRRVLVGDRDPDGGSWEKAIGGDHEFGALAVSTEPNARRLSPGAAAGAGIATGAGGVSRGGAMNFQAAARATPARTSATAPIRMERRIPADA